MNGLKSALEILEETSRTFYIPIIRLPPNLQEAVASAYLCMRAIDEIEDHPTLENPVKSQILSQMSWGLQSGVNNGTLAQTRLDWGVDESEIPEVSLRLYDWATLAPEDISPRIWDATAAMANRMAAWAECNWNVVTQRDLDCYTFSVAGAVGLMLSDLWAWYDGTQTNRMEAIAFGRGLQAVNILRNHHEDLQRGVDFFPQGWTSAQMQAYARKNLELANQYTESLPPGPALEFCKIPLALAHATLEVLHAGEEKLSRTAVLTLIQQMTSYNN